MSYKTIYIAAKDPLFQGRCMVAVWIAAYNIINESPETPNHDIRLVWAKAVHNETKQINMSLLAHSVLINPQIGSDPSAASDGDIQYQVNSIIDRLIELG